jgi:hypothetical protein
MTAFEADADTLDQHGEIHLQIAQFYRDVHDRVLGRAGRILSAFSGAQSFFSDELTSRYNEWLQTSNLDEMENKAQLHETWAQYFFDLADEVRAAEGTLDLGGSQKTSGGGFVC